MLTRASVDCADRIVAISSSNAFVKSSEHFASGYFFPRRLITSFARALTSFTARILIRPMTTTIDAARVIRSPRGTELSCRGWQQEAALRMLMNNLDPEVAERP